MKTNRDPFFEVMKKNIKIKVQPHFHKLQYQNSNTINRVKNINYFIIKSLIIEKYFITLCVSR